MAAPAENTSNKQPQTSEDKKWNARAYPQNKEKKDGIPMLKFRKGNNFYKFRQAMTEVCLKEYGNLGCLIKEEKACIPEFVKYVAPMESTLYANELKALKMEEVKEYAKKVAKVEADKPKM
jgi:hypothetical protein